MYRFILPLLTLTLALPVFATDGVMEINQTCVVNTGCFSGDTAGFPVTISASGSYRLTGNLTNGNENLRTIDVTADNVTIDLNGFSIVGPVACTGAGPGISCSPAGSGQGIYAAENAHTTVLNGTVRGAGQDGLSLGDSCRVDGVETHNNGRFGIAGGDFCSVRNSSARGNAQRGITLGEETSVENCVSAENGTNGVEVGASSRVVGVRASANNYGIVVGGGSLVQDCVAEGNTNHGIRVTGPGSRVESCVATNNNIGISMDADGCTAVNNTSMDNTSDGIASGVLGSTSYSQCVFDGNHLARNSGRGLLVTGTDNIIVRNMSQGNGFAYVILAGNQVGMVVSAVDLIGVAGSSGGNLDATIGAWTNLAR